MTKRGGVLSSDAAASAPSPSPLVASATLGAPNVKPLVLGVGDDPASGVFGGLPKPKPTGLPMLPPPLDFPKLNVAFGAAEPNAKGEGAAGEGFSGVAGPPKILVRGAESFGLSFCSAFGSSGVIPNGELEKAEGALPKMVPSVFFPESPNTNGLLESEAPNWNADLTPLDAPASENLLESLDGLSPNAKVLLLGGLDTSWGLNPPSPNEVTGAAGDKLNPENPLGGAGIEKVLFVCGVGVGAEVDIDEGPPNPLNDEGAEGAFGSAFDVGVCVEGRDFFKASSKSDLIPDLSSLYLSRTPAMSVYGSASTAFLQAARKATFNPRSAV